MFGEVELTGVVVGVPGIAREKYFAIKRETVRKIDDVPCEREKERETGEKNRNRETNQEERDRVNIMAVSFPGVRGVGGVLCRERGEVGGRLPY